jgi:SAM-dependent methyltransferase
MPTDKKFQKLKAPWPTKKVMDQIYEKKLWGRNQADFYSGEGSHLPEIVNPYVESVTAFLTSFKTRLTVCDLGCGDFNVGKQLFPFTQKYVAVDIVADLIEYNQKIFKAENLEFLCLDIAMADIPIADCVLLRHVLQHLSNAEVQRIVDKLAQYKYVILTEHLPLRDFVPNVDILSGQGIRLKKQSGISLTDPPFNFNYKDEQQIVSTILKDGKGRVVTTLYTVF